MKLRDTGVFTFGLAVAVSLGAATATFAQTDTARTRVPVKKEQGAVPVKKEQAAVPVTKEPIAAPVAARPDTAVRTAPGDVVAPKDTAAAAVAPAKCAMMPEAPANPAARLACGAMATMPAQVVQPMKRESATRYLFGKSGFYLGAGAGTAIPFNLLGDIGYDAGFNLSIPVGWQQPNRTLGLRATFAFDQLHAKLATADVTAPAMLGSAPDPKIYSGTADAILKFPIGKMAREGRGLSLYTVGGGGVYLFRGFGGTTQLGNVLGNDRVGSSKKNVHKWGIEAGAGMEYGLGPTAVFVESRWVNVFTNGSQAGNDYLRWIPIAVGVTLR